MADLGDGSIPEGLAAQERRAYAITQKLIEDYNKASGQQHKMPYFMASPLKGKYGVHDPWAGRITLNSLRMQDPHLWALTIPHETAHSLRQQELGRKSYRGDSHDESWKAIFEKLIGYVPPGVCVPQNPRGLLGDD